MGGFLSTSHAHNHTSSSAGPPPGSNPPAHPHNITRLSRGTLLFMWIVFYFLLLLIFFYDLQVCIPPKILVYTLLYKLYK